MRLIASFDRALTQHLVLQLQMLHSKRENQQQLKFYQKNILAKASKTHLCSDLHDSQPTIKIQRMQLERFGTIKYVIQ